MDEGVYDALRALEESMKREPRLVDDFPEPDPVMDEGTYDALWERIIRLLNELRELEARRKLERRDEQG